MKNKLKILIFIFVLILVSSPSISCKKPEPEISYIGLGGQGTVSGSMHCLKIDKKLYMVDSGSFYGDDGENYPLPHEIEVNNLKAVFITHAHADHIGRLPLLLEMGYSGPIYMTSVTYDITKIMLITSIQYSGRGEETFYYSKNNKSKIKPVYLEGYDFGDRQVKEKNKIYIESKREELGDKCFYMSDLLIDILEDEMLQKLERQVIIVDYNRPFNVDNEVTAEFLYTSHIPGSAMVLLNIKDKNIFFSGDIGSNNNPFLKQNKPFSEEIDYLFVEGTYGIGSNNSNNEAERIEFQQIIGNKLNEGYRIIIPAFVLDRTQQVIYEIMKGMEKNYISKNTNVKVYSPTSEKITDLYIRYSSHSETYEQFFSKQMFANLFNIKDLIYNSKNSDNSYNTDINYGEIAIMSSGMASSVFSKDAINTYIEDPKTFIILVGYQAEGTEGRKLLDAHYNEEDYVYFDGEKKIINPDNIYRSYAFNSHADFEQIVDTFKNSKPKKIFLVHLNQSDVDDMVNKYQQLFLNTEVIAPLYSVEYDLKY